MREIKFRAWHKSKEKMEYGITVNPKNKLVITIFETWYFKSIELMQYAGLKDIDKKELYDGDFFKDDEGMLYLIEWDAGGLQWYAVDVLNNGEWSMNLGEFVGVKIAYRGNRYENPELLTSQQGSGKAG